MKILVTRMLRQNQQKALNENESTPLIFRMSETGPPLLRTILENLGWQEYIENESTYWNLWWKGNRFPQSLQQDANPLYQRVNHFDNTTSLTRKDVAARQLRKMKGIYGSVYNFFPLTFSLPNEYLKFIKQYALDEELNKRKLWIVKPTDKSRGRGIFLVKTLSDLTYDTNIIIQSYIERPFLVSGYKFDIRCYIVVRSFHPLVVYIHNEGLARFATEKYDTLDYSNMFSHLTNTSINKNSPTVDHDKNEVGAGCKWTLSKLKYFLNHKRNIDFNGIWNLIKSVVLLTVIPIANDVSNHSFSSFELFGFDILLDEYLKPWLLEVNLSPALTVDEDIDILVKKPLLTDIISLQLLSDDAGKLASQNKPNRIIKKKQQFPDQVGGFEKIYPFGGNTSGILDKNLIQKIKAQYK